MLWWRKKIKEVNNTQKNETVLKLQILHMEWAFKIYFSTFWTPIICIVSTALNILTQLCDILDKGLTFGYTCTAVL